MGALGIAGALTRSNDGRREKDFNFKAGCTAPQKCQASGKPDFLRAMALRRKSLAINGASDEIRTRDLMITNQLLYQLSYAGVA
jgi:hypothetical protein